MDERPSVWGRLVVARLVGPVVARLGLVVVRLAMVWRNKLAVERMARLVVVPWLAILCLGVAFRLVVVRLGLVVVRLAMVWRKLAVELMARLVVVPWLAISCLGVAFRLVVVRLGLVVIRLAMVWRKLAVEPMARLGWSPGWQYQAWVWHSNAWWSWTKAWWSTGAWHYGWPWSQGREGRFLAARDWPAIVTRPPLLWHYKTLHKTKIITLKQGHNG